MKRHMASAGTANGRFTVRNFVLTATCALLLTACSACCEQPGSSPGPQAPEPRVEWAIAIHGGAGTVPRDIDPELRDGYLEGLNAALRAGVDRLEAGESALDVVEEVVVVLEDDERFNAGRGAVFTREGRHELDAAIMDGRTRDCGSVAAVTTLRNPIRLARLVVEASQHVFLMGPGAEAFGEEMGLEVVENSFFSTERRRAQLERKLAREAAGEGMGTVGAVALDRNGDLAAATSTGGLTGKRWGRVGDVPIIGAGTFADNASCAVSATGQGEQFIRHSVAGSIAALVEHRGLAVDEAARRLIHETLDPGDGGVIVVGRDGSIAQVFSTSGMYRGAADATGRFELAIWN
jgi:beta-aspartyl-peptidase (threonine type)